MGLLDFFKSTNKKDDYSKLDILELYDLIYENSYVDNIKTKKLFDAAFEVTKNNVIQRHFVYNKIIDFYYGLRDQEEEALEKCTQYCFESIEYTPTFLKASREKHDKSYAETIKYIPEREYVDFVPPAIPAFQRLAIINENQGKYTEAIGICQKAIILNLKDGTKSGFEGRIARLTKKMNK